MFLIVYLKCLCNSLSGEILVQPTKIQNITEEDKEQEFVKAIITHEENVKTVSNDYYSKRFQGVHF